MTHRKEMVYRTSYSHISAEWSAIELKFFVVVGKTLRSVRGKKNLISDDRNWTRGKVLHHSIELWWKMLRWYWNDAVMLKWCCDTEMMLWYWDDAEMMLWYWDDAEMIPWYWDSSAILLYLLKQPAGYTNSIWWTNSALCYSHYCIVISMNNPNI